MNETIYVLGYWCNPYRPEKEWYWFRCYDGMKSAKGMGALKQTRGQPSRFTDWVKGQNKYFTDVKKFYDAAKAAGMNPRLDKYEMESILV